MAETDLEILVIGAGFAGIGAAIRLRQAGIDDFAIFDQADGIGGTWWYNTYPGATCDIPSHFYCYSFEPRPRWSRRYAPQPEIQAYLEHCVDKYGLRPHLRLGRRIVSLGFDDDAGIWRARFADGETVSARFVVNGSGVLHEPALPAFEGAGTFGGTTMHAARWDETFDPAGRRVAIVGSAASAIQILPAIADRVARATLFQRTPNYVLPRRDHAYSERVKRWFERFPALARLYRWKLFMERELLVFPAVTSDRHRRFIKRIFRRFVYHEVKDWDTQQRLYPHYQLGCKRILISDDYLASLNRDNVELVTEPIERFVPQGVVTADGVTRQFDAIVYATGFDIERHRLSIEVVGSNGLTLRQAWKDGARAYLGVMVPGFPNYFLVTGPNTGVGTTSVVFMIEQAVDWIVACIRQCGGGRVVSVREEACAAYNARLQADMRGTVWVSGCDSWYRRADGTIDVLYPRDARSFRRELRKPDPGALDFASVAAPPAPEQSRRHESMRA